MSLASQNSPSVVGMLADLRAAQEAVRGARSKRLPAVSANGFATAGSYGSIYPSAPRVDPGYSVLTPSGGFLDANLMLMVPLFTGGTLESSIGAAGSLELAAAFDVREAQADATLGAEDSYLRALLAGENESAAASRIASNQELVRTTRAQFEAGKGIEASVRRVEAELAQSERSLATARGQREKALLELKAALGIDLDSAVVLSDPLPNPGAPDPVTTYVETAMKSRPALGAARARLRAAEADVRAAEGSRKPQLYGVAMADVATRPMARGASVGLVLSVPVFDGGGRRAETARVRALRDRAAANVRQAELSAQREVREAFVDRTTSEENVRSAEASVESARTALEAASLRVSNGKGILLEELDALRALTQARADLAQARYDRALAVARLRRAAGISQAEGGAK